MPDRKKDRSAETPVGGMDLDADLIHAYLGGAATPSEQERVRDAVARSPELARQIRELVEDLEELSSPGIEDAIRCAQVDPVPDLDILLRDRTEREAETLGQRIVRGLRDFVQGVELLPLTPALTRGEGLPDPENKEVEQLIKVAATSDVAAAHAIACSVHELDGEFVLSDARLPGGESPQGETHRVEFFDSAGAFATVIQIVVPPDADEARVWFLFPPSLQLQGVALDATDLRVSPWPSPAGPAFYVAVWRERGEYRSDGVQRLEL